MESDTWQREIQKINEQNLKEKKKLEFKL